MSLAPLLVALSLCTPAPAVDFNLRDAASRTYRLDDFRESRVVVVVFLGVDCPLAKLYAPRLVDLEKRYRSKKVAFVAIDSNEHDALADLHRFARDNSLTFPLLKDTGNIAADRFGAQRTPEAFVLDDKRQIRYHGRIDDQYTVGQRRPQATRSEMCEAIDALITDGVPPVFETVAPGCIINRVERPKSGATSVTYCRDIAPLLQAHCQSCHRPGQAGPFSLLTYDDAKNWAQAIRENVDAGLMPPWSVDRHSLPLANDPSLTGEQKKTLFAWIDADCPEGDRRDLPAPRVFSDGWTIGKPDRIVSIPKPFTVPAQGVVEYQYIAVDPGFREDVWVKAAEIRPGNAAVVHHCNIFLQPPGFSDPKMIAELGPLGSVCFTQTTPGTPPMILPDGTAKKIPAGWKIIFVIHYQPIGSEQTDQTRLGLVLADPKSVRREVATRLMYGADFVIPPRAGDHVISQTWNVHRDVQLLSFFPHMHLRGKSFRYDLIAPDGSERILLHVPRYDFNWQHRYLLADPLWIGAGSQIRCTAVYDNSPGNPNNPDPETPVKAGPQSTDEMFNGYFDVVLADEDRLRPLSLSERIGTGVDWFGDRPVAAVGIGIAGALYLARRRIRLWLQPVPATNG